MRINKLKPNYFLTLRYLSNESKFKLFCSEHEPEKLIYEIKRNIKEKYPEENNNKTIRIVVKNIDSKEMESTSINIPEKSLEEIKEIMVIDLIKKELIIDVKKTRYQITIRNKFSKSIDTKIFSFNSQKSFNELFEELKEFYDNFTHHDIDISFHKKPTNETSHYLILSYAGSMNQYKKPSKTFSIKLSNYSSSEIIQLVQGGKNEN